ncbi:2'-5' RNA ligase family protein [Streptomyces diacarni]|uniref:2'-5' RNA ligase family protein n=1 Tax=Streptomyces diacarni TaxID=2800381 RepID=UPI001FE7B6B8|nr:2'-5' RNA ligase family protein [Streptomyces diacarni]
MDGTEVGRNAPATRSAAGPADGGAEEGWPVASGTTALSVAVPEVDAVVRGWRARYDTAARHGGVAHVTVLFPFLHRDLITAAERAALRGLFAARPAFTLTFADCARFPGVLYLVPEPAAPLRALTAEVARRWPSHPPYGGLFGELAPHLTVANSGGEDVHRRAEAHLRARLPVTAQVDSVDLVVHEEGRWLPWLDFPLGR